MLSIFTSLVVFTALAVARTVEYRWDVTWVNANPDGQFDRPVIGINGKWPCPTIEASVGDEVKIVLTNKLGNETTSLHFHGLFQKGTNQMDGPSSVTQCPIPPDQTFTYRFNIDQPGTYWYHSHNKGQYPDGLRGPLIVNDPRSPYKNQYDEERVLSLSDWYHTQMPALIHEYQSTSNIAGSEPVPNSAIMNDESNTKLKVAPGKTYLVRIINISAFAAFYLNFEGHQMTVVEIDGVYVDPQDTNLIMVAAAQRYSVLIHAKSDANRNFAFLGSMDLHMFDRIPLGFNPNITGQLIYDDHKALSPPPVLSNFDALDDITLVPVDHAPLLTSPAKSIVFQASFAPVNGVIRGFLNDNTYLPPRVPTLYTALSAPPSLKSNPIIYGPTTNPYILPYNSVIEIVVNNYDNGSHPFHLHGHQFQVVKRSPGNYVAPEPWDGLTAGLTKQPMRRDTVMVRNFGHIVIRFQADNPGVYLFHCHIEWHVEGGMTATMIEAPEKIALVIPKDHMDVCQAQNIKTQGNAAGNTVNYTDLSGANTQLPSDPWGALIKSPSIRRRRRRAPTSIASL